MTTEMMTPEYAQAKIVISTMSMLLNRASSAMDSSDEAVAKFTKELQGSNPAYAFEWAHGTMQTVACGNVARSIHQALTQGSNVWRVRESLQDKLMHSAKYPEFSTSPTRNLMNQFITAGVAEWLDTITNAISYLEKNGIQDPSAPSTTDEA